MSFGNEMGHCSTSHTPPVQSGIAQRAGLAKGAINMQPVENWLRIDPLLLTAGLSCAGPHYNDNASGRWHDFLQSPGVMSQHLAVDPETGFENLPHTHRTVRSSGCKGVMAHAHGVHSCCNLGLIVPGCPGAQAQRVYRSRSTIMRATALPLEAIYKPAKDSCAASLHQPDSAQKRDDEEK